MPHFCTLYVSPSLRIDYMDTNEGIDELELLREHGDAFDGESKRVGSAPAVDGASSPSSRGLQLVTSPKPELSKKHGLPNTAMSTVSRSSGRRICLGHSR